MCQYETLGQERKPTSQQLRMPRDAGVRRVVDNSFGYRAVRIFNSLPKFVRDYEGDSTWFKNRL